MNNINKLIVLSISLFFQFLFSGVIYYVDTDTTGANWYEEMNFSFDLNSALTLATDGDTIFVAAGTYTAPAGGFSLANGVRVYGGFTGGENSIIQRTPKINQTILSGNNTSRVISVTGSATNLPLLDGLIIADGNAGAGNGGGLLLSATENIYIKNCIFRNNSAENGAAIYSTDFANNVNATLQIDSCLFDANTATTNGGVSDGTAPGGNGTLTITINQSTFVNNSATNGSVAAAGNNVITVNISNAVFWSNTNSIWYTYGGNNANQKGIINISNSGSDQTLTTDSQNNFTATNITSYTVSPFRETTYYYLSEDDSSGYGWIGVPLILDIAIFLEGGL